MKVYGDDYYYQTNRQPSLKKITHGRGRNAKTIDAKHDNDPNYTSEGDGIIDLSQDEYDDVHEEMNCHTTDKNTVANSHSTANESGIRNYPRGGNNDNSESAHDGMDEDTRSNTSNDMKLHGELTEDGMREEAEMWKGVGNRHMASQEYSKAYSAYSTSLSLSPLGPSSHIYLSNRAASLLSLKRYSAASVDARRAITLAPTFGKAHARLGQSLYFLKDYAGAVGAYEDAFTYEPDNQVTWTYLNKARKKLDRKRSVGGGAGGGLSSVTTGVSGRKVGWDMAHGDTAGGAATEFHVASPTAAGGSSLSNDMMSVTDSINLQNMKITVDDASDKKSINKSIMKDQIYSIQENDDPFYDEIFDLSEENKDQPSNQPFPDASKLQINSPPYNPNNPNNHNENECKQNYKFDHVVTHPTDETEENSVTSEQQKCTHQPPHQPSCHYCVSPENDDTYTTKSDPDPDFDEALKIQQSASKHLLDRHYKLAVEEFSAALFLVPDDDNLTPSLFVGRSYALNGQGRHVSAQNDAMMALGRRPDLVDGHVVLARSLFYAGDLRGALRSFENASVCLQRNFGDVGGGGIEDGDGDGDGDGDDGSGLSKLDQLYMEKARAGLIEKEKNGPSDDNDDDDRSHGYSILSGSSKPVPKLQPPRFVPREKLLKSTSCVPSMPKAWSIQVPQSPPSLRVGPERLITFFSHCLGITLNRGSDGIIRIVSVTDDTNFSKLPSGEHQVHRKGSVESGDVIREAAGVDLRRPITKFMWSDTVSLLKVSPRPVMLIVSKELSDPPQGFANEVSKSMVKVGTVRSKWGGSRDGDADYDGEEEKREFTKIPNMPDTYGSFKRPSRSGGTEAVVESIRAMTMDEDCVDDNVDASQQEVVLPLEIADESSEGAFSAKTVTANEKDVEVGKEEATVRKKDGNIDGEKKDPVTQADDNSNIDIVESTTVVVENDGDVEQNEPVTNPDLKNSVESERSDDSNNKSVEFDTTVVVKDINGEQKDVAANPYGSNSSNVQSKVAIGLKNDNNDEELKEPAIKSADEIDMRVDINYNAIDDKEETKTMRILGSIDEDSTEKNEDTSIMPIVSNDSTRKTNNVKSSDLSFDGASYSQQIADSSDGNMTFTDMSSYLSLSEDCSDAGSGIGMLETPVYPSRKRNDVTEGLVDEDPLYRKEILFVRSEKDTNSSSSSPTLGWTNDRWLAKSPQRVLIYSRHVQFLTKGRFFWSADQYVPRALALYKNPNLILVLRPPLNVSEVRESLNIPDELDLSSKRNTDLTDLYWVAERVIDLHTCKLRLSSLTTPTSVVMRSESGGGGGGGGASENESGSINDCRRATCFELINPSENILISPVVICASGTTKSGDNNGGGGDVQVKNDGEDDIYSGKSAIMVTTWWESAITKSLCAAHAPDHLNTSTNTSSDKSWKHQIVLGSLHSHVVSGSFAALQKAIEIIIKSRITDASAIHAPKNVSIDKMDENGMTALHYACTSRSASAVAMLVKAGADCTIPTKSECKTPCHLSAELLDQTSINVILAASKPRRPDPNALDSYGNTPMYSAAVHGRSVGGTGGNPDQLRDCLLAFEAWGGQLYLLSNVIAETNKIMKTRKTSRHKNKLSTMEELSTVTNQVKVMPHPIHSVSAEWRHAELETLFAFCPHRFPIESEGQFGFGRSLGALFDYPLHACVISLRKKLIEFKQKRRSDMFGQATGEPSLISTMRVLLNHGLEPNERLEYINSATEFALEMNEMTGFTPVQILAGAALDIISDRQESEEKGLEADPSLEFVSFYVVDSVELLLQYGARISIEPPPIARPNRENPLQDLVLQLLRGGMTSLPIIDRGKLNIEKNGDIMSVFGGKAKLSRLRAKWYHAKAAKAPPGCKIPTGKEFPSSIPDFELPG